MTNGTKHLVRERHDVTNRVTSIWCSAMSYSHDAVDDASDCDCKSCLSEAADFGRKAAARYIDISARQESP